MILKGAVALWISRVVRLLANRIRLGNPGGKKGMFFPVQVRKTRNFQILVYHRVGEASHYVVDLVPVPLFERQMELLSLRFNILPLTELVERSGRGDLPMNALAVTFDDGYRDNYEYAYPILKKFKIPATIFLATGCIGTSGMPWHERVFSFFRTFSGKSIRFGGESHDMSEPHRKSDLLVRMINRMRDMDPPSRDLLIDEILSLNPNPDYAAIKRTMMNWDEIREMVGGGIEIGAHTVNHPILSRISRSEAAKEIAESKNQVERQIGRVIHSFAYPNGQRGDYDDAHKSCIREAGFRCAVTTNWGNNDRNSDYFELRRIFLWGSEPETSILLLSYYKFF